MAYKHERNAQNAQVALLLLSHEHCIILLQKDVMCIYKRCWNAVGIANHVDLSAILEIIAGVMHQKEMSLQEVKPSAISPSNVWREQLFPRIAREFMGLTVNHIVDMVREVLALERGLAG